MNKIIHKLLYNFYLLNKLFIFIILILSIFVLSNLNKNIYFYYFLNSFPNGNDNPQITFPNNGDFNPLFYNSFYEYSIFTGQYTLNQLDNKYLLLKNDSSIINSLDKDEINNYIENKNKIIYDKYLIHDKGKCGLKDIFNNLILKCIYDKIDFIDNLILARLDNDIYIFYNNKLTAKINNNNNDKYELFNSKYIIKNNNELLNCFGNSLSKEFNIENCNISFASNNDNIFIIQNNEGFYGYYNKKLNYISNCKYKYIYGFIDNVYSFAYDQFNEIFIINGQNQFIYHIPNKYKLFSPITLASNYFVLYYDNFFYFFDLQTFDLIYKINKDNIYFKNKIITNDTIIKINNNKQYQLFNIRTKKYVGKSFIELNYIKDKYYIAKYENNFGETLFCLENLNGENFFHDSSNISFNFNVLTLLKNNKTFYYKLSI